MTSGAFIIGRPIGPTQKIRPFTSADFRDLKEKCGLGLIIKHSVQVAYPFCLDDPTLEYREGILCDVYGGEERETAEKLEADVRDRLIVAGLMAEKLDHQYGMREIPNPFPHSDLDYQKVLHVDTNAEGEIARTPFVERVEIYDDETGERIFPLLAMGFIVQTAAARSRRAQSRIDRIAKEDLEALTQKYQPERS